jgi:hypothetical protein
MHTIHIQNIEIITILFYCLKATDMHKTSIMSNRLLHVSKNSIWIAHILTEYFINCDPSTELQENCLYQFISEHKNMHMHTHKTDRDTENQPMDTSINVESVWGMLLNC